MVCSRGRQIAPPVRAPQAQHSLPFDIGGPDDRGPSRNLALEQRGEPTLAARSLGRNAGAELGEAPAQSRIVERAIKRGCQLVADRLWRSLGGEQGKP